MTLNYCKIKEITCGAAYIDTEDGFFCFHRFTPEQEAIYTVRSADFCKKAFATSGVKLCFETDSKYLFLKGRVRPGSSRAYYAADLFINGEFAGSISNFDGVELPINYTAVRLDGGAFEKRFALGEGVKRLCFYLPWSVNMQIEAISLDDGAFIKPIKAKKRLIAFGDSITQGYDALHPAHKYITKIADFLQADEYNKAVGAEIFCPPLSKATDDFVPEYIAVAYGTNDWSKCGVEFEYNCREFLTELCSRYSAAKVFVITPIWRSDIDTEKCYGAFGNIERYIGEVVSSIDNAVLISGADLVPKSEAYYADLRLHPNDEGFWHYAENLKIALKKAIG